MFRPTMARETMAALIVERVNAQAPEKIEGIHIIDVTSIGSSPNWTAGDYWPPAPPEDGLTEIIFGVINDLRHKFDIEG